MSPDTIYSSITPGESTSVEVVLLFFPGSEKGEQSSDKLIIHQDRARPSILANYQVASINAFWNVLINRCSSPVNGTDGNDGNILLSHDCPLAFRMCRNYVANERKGVKRVKKSRIEAIWIRASLLDGNPS